MTSLLRAAFLFALALAVAYAPSVAALQPPVSTEQNPIVDAAIPHFDPPTEIRLALVRLPFAALFGTALALRPRRRSQGPRKVVVMQTQIMLWPQWSCMRMSSEDSTIS